MPAMAAEGDVQFASDPMSAFALSQPKADSPLTTRKQTLTCNSPRYPNWAVSGQAAFGEKPDKRLGKFLGANCG